MIEQLTKKIEMTLIHKRMLADQVTPVGLYLKVREHFEHSVLLESNDFRSAENCYSMIGVEPIAGFKVQDGILTQFEPGELGVGKTLSSFQQVPTLFNDFIGKFNYGSLPDELPISPGFFGHSSFDSIPYFEQITFDPNKRTF